MQKGELVKTLNDRQGWEIHYTFDMCENCQDRKAYFTIVDEHRNVFFLCSYCQERLEEKDTDTRSDEQIADDLWNDSNPENCDGCANQASIAAPGETTKCREHQEKTDDGIDRWFDERATLFRFHPFGNWCSRCMKDEAYYIGVTDSGTPFQFCKPCRDDLVRRADAAKQSPERFGV